MTIVRKRQGKTGAKAAPKGGTETGYDRSLPIEQWISYRFGLILSRVGQFTADMYRSMYKLSQPGWRSLAVIARYEPLSAGELAGRTSSDPFKVGRALEALTEQGLIVRDADPSDRRKARLRLTKKGWLVYRDVEQLSQRLERYLKEALDPEDVRRLEEIMRILDARVVELINDFTWQDLMRD